MALKCGCATSVVIGTLIYASLQLKFVSKSLENLSNMEDSDCSQIEQKHSVLYTGSIRVKNSTTESVKSMQQIVNHFRYQAKHESQIVVTYTNTDTSITTADCVMDQERKKGSCRLPSDNISSLEDCIKTIIKTPKGNLAFCNLTVLFLSSDRNANLFPRSFPLHIF